MFGLTTDEAVFEANNATLHAKLDVYEKILSKQKYVAGDELTLADLFHLPYGNLVAQTGSDAIAKRPNVSRCVPLYPPLKIRVLTARFAGGLRSSPTGLPGSLLRMRSRVQRNSSPVSMLYLDASAIHERPGRTESVECTHHIGVNSNTNRSLQRRCEWL